jgi:hypothetical protein
VRITDISVRSVLSRVRWNDMPVRRDDSSVEVDSASVLIAFAGKRAHAGACCGANMIHGGRHSYRPLVGRRGKAGSARPPSPCFHGEVGAMSASTSPMHSLSTATFGGTMTIEEESYRRPYITGHIGVARLSPDAPDASDKSVWRSHREWDTRAVERARRTLLGRLIHLRVTIRLHAKRQPVRALAERPRLHRPWTGLRSRHAVLEVK